MLRVFFLLLLLTFTGPSFAYAKADLPMPLHYVEDYANVINNSDEHSLNGILQELQQKCGAQYIVLTVQTAGGLPIEQFAIELAEKWKLGQKGKDNGPRFPDASSALIVTKYSLPGSRPVILSSSFL